MTANVPVKLPTAALYLGRAHDDWIAYCESDACPSAALDADYHALLRRFVQPPVQLVLLGAGRREQTIADKLSHRVGAVFFHGLDHLGRCNIVSTSTRWTRGYVTESYRMTGDLSRPMVWPSPGPAKQQVVTLLGGTVGNLEDDLGALRRIREFCQPDDLLVLDFAVRLPEAEETRLTQPQPEAERRWWEAAIQAYDPGAEQIEVQPPTTWVDHTTLFRERHLTIAYHARYLSGGEPTEIEVLRFRRYETAFFVEELRALGWTVVAEDRPTPKTKVLVLAAYPVLAAGGPSDYMLTPQPPNDALVWMPSARSGAEVSQIRVGPGDPLGSD